MGSERSTDRVAAFVRARPILGIVLFLAIGTVILTSLLIGIGALFLHLLNPAMLSVNNAAQLGFSIVAVVLGLIVMYLMRREDAKREVQEDLVGFPAPDVPHYPETKTALARRFFAWWYPERNFSRQAVSDGQVQSLAFRFLLMAPVFVLIVLIGATGSIPPGSLILVLIAFALLLPISIHFSLRHIDRQTRSAALRGDTFQPPALRRDSPRLLFVALAMGVFTVLLGIVVVALIGGISSVVRGHDLSDSTMRFSVVAVLVVGALVAAWSWYSTHSKLAARRVQGAQSSQAADARATAEAEEARRRQEAEAAHRRRLADAKRDVMSAVWWYHHVGPPTPETVKVHALAHLDDILADAKGIEHRHHTSPLADLAWRRELAAHAAEDWCEELDRPHTASELSDILAARWRFDMECLEAAKRLDQERRLASRVPEELTHHDEARRADIYFETEAQRRVSIETRLAEARRQAEAFKERLLLDQVPEDEAQRLARRRLQQLRGPILETARAAGILDYEDESADI